MIDLSSEQQVGKFEDATYAMFIPTESDCSAVKKELIVLVSRVLVQYVPCLRIFQDLVPSHIYHKYSKEVCQASEIVSFSSKIVYIATCIIYITIGLNISLLLYMMKTNTLYVIV